MAISTKLPLPSFPLCSGYSSERRFSSWVVTPFHDRLGTSVLKIDHFKIDRACSRCWQMREDKVPSKDVLTCSDDERPLCAILPCGGHDPGACCSFRSAVKRETCCSCRWRKRAGRQIPLPPEGKGLCSSGTMAVPNRSDPRPPRELSLSGFMHTRQMRDGTGRLRDTCMKPGST
jgi:hypothetical protein